MLSQKPLQHPSLVLWKQEGEINIYENKTALKGVYWIESQELDSVSPLRIPFEELGDRHEIPIEIFDMRENRITVAMEAQRPGYLLVTSSCYPGWRAWIEGEAVQVDCANNLFMAVPVGPGQHTIHFRFSWIHGLLNDA